MIVRSWDKLPQELLRRTFEYIQLAIVATHPCSGGDNYQKATAATQSKTFTACQLVCKAWSNEAQRILYQGVNLEKNSTSFVKTITVAPPLAAFVNTVYFSSQVLAASDPAGSLEQLFLKCRNITAIRRHTTITAILSSSYSSIFEFFYLQQAITVLA
jgi:hypothetical protein